MMGNRIPLISGAAMRIAAISQPEVIRERMLPPL